ncbi:MAG: LacI family DNA-binding transcriptional regulator [Saccharofermentanales bacterium]
MADASIKKIAEVAGVSRGTVDRALNNRSGISAVQKELILRVAADLGYHSNRAGRMLSIRKSPIRIGVHMPSDGNDFFDEVKAGLYAAEAHYRDFGLSLSIRTMKGFDSAVQERQIRELLGEGVSSLAIVPISSPPISALLNELADRDFPVVTFNSDISGTRRLCYVGNDYFRSGAAAGGALRLLTHGAQSRQRAGGEQSSPGKVLIMTGSERILGHSQRVAGFTQVIRQHCPDLQIFDVVETQDDEDTAYNLAMSAISACPSLAAVYIAAGGVAGACRAIEESGLAGRIDVICNDLTGTEREYLARGVISLTIGQQPYEQGYKSIQYLFDYFLDGTRPPEFTYTNSELLIRENLPDFS